MPDPVPVTDDRTRRSRLLLRTLIGAVLRRARLDQGRTLADVARMARVSMQYLSELERGRKEASSEVLAAICEALRIELADVLTEVAAFLAADRARRAPVGRLDVVPVRAQSRGSGDVFCLAA
ncbi:helix-turn-helix domain-containing protein [Phytomonospora endophytica]|uniref:Transcriptional regulator with XRE-family HTH domain n=1 Tax=Phytomonospora endophytica TaxID=714109 RepID=A0A841FIF9_9ACTN|nr:transcriptional regulator with XRE-family HTH domain [Phytomonospora endophytica]GIG69053.1 hypothetical protein Pen01_53480 [Phytomonospora endophytica]